MLAGGTPAVLASGQNQPGDLAVDATNVYWLNDGTGNDDSSVVKVPIAGGAPVALASAGAMPRHIAVDGATLYVANERSHEVMEMRIDPQTGIPALAQTIEIPSPTVVLP